MSDEFTHVALDPDDVGHYVWVDGSIWTLCEVSSRPREEMWSSEELRVRSQARATCLRCVALKFA